MTYLKHIQKGFTLIELLIVVAIIAILAAIAIPNFLAAQTRSKVARLRAEFRTIATALESYYVDSNSYPIYRSPNSQNGVFGDDDFGSNRFDVLTTPIAYITSYPQDPFRFVGADGQSAAAGMGYFIYTWQRYVRPGESTAPFTVGGGGPHAVIWQASHWALRSRGPDGAWNSLVVPGDASRVQVPWLNDPARGSIDGDVTLVTYDPTNGTISRGDIYRTSRRGQL